jgi:hypothetical protein
MVGSINYYFSIGMLSLFIDAPTNPDHPTMTQKTFRGNSMITQQDAWDVITHLHIAFYYIQINFVLI